MTLSLSTNLGSSQRVLEDQERVRYVDATVVVGVCCLILARVGLRKGALAS